MAPIYTKYAKKKIPNNEGISNFEKVCVFNKLVPERYTNGRAPAGGGSFRIVLFQLEIAQKLLGLQIIYCALWKAENHSFSMSALSTL
mgnify:CR=1 FL=1